MDRQFWVKVYVADNTYWADGHVTAIYCNHVYEGKFGLNKEGQIVPLPGAQFADLQTSPPSTTDVAVPAVLIPHGTVFPSASQPNLDLVEVIQIKDMVQLVTYYVDAADYAAKISQCNP